MESSRLEENLAKLREDYIASNPLSKDAFQQAGKYLPGGNTRSVLHSDPFPLAVQSAKGQFITSLDGQTYVDFVSNFSEGIYGHSHPVLQEATKDALATGFSFGAVTTKEAELGSILKTRFARMDYVRFCNSGSEANMFAILAARAFTRRQKVMVFRNGYHGGPLSFGRADEPMNLPFDFVIAEYNNIEGTRRLINQNPDIAAILVEPMQSAGGLKPATNTFLTFLREEATQKGAVLIFDEVVTSRLHYNGLQGHFGVYPDMTSLGKYIGGGFSFGAFGGRAEIMQQFDPQATAAKDRRVLHHSGTFNNNTFTMTAAVAASRLITPESLSALNRLGDKLRSGAEDICHAARCLDLTWSGMGSMIGIHFGGVHSDILRDCFYFYLLKQGFIVGRRGFIALNLMHTETDINQLLEGIKGFVAEYMLDG